jgi:hypothetical protein
MVTFTYRNDTVDDMGIGDGGEDGGRSPARTTNSPGSSLANANKRSTFSFCALVDLGKIAREWGGVRGRETLKARDRFSYCHALDVCIVGLYTLFTTDVPPSILKLLVLNQNLEVLP